MPASTLFDYATRLQTVLEGTKKTVASQFSAQVTSLVQEGVRLLKQYEGTLAGVKLQKFVSAAKDKQRELMDEAIASLNKDLDQIMFWQQGSEAGFLNKALDTTLEILSRDKLIKAVRAHTMQATGQLLDTFLKDWSQRQIDAMWNEVNKQVARGATISQIANAIQGTKPRRMQDGFAQKSKDHAETVARTAVQQVSTATRAELYINNSDIVEGYTFVATLDNRTTPICQALDGQSFEMGQGPLPPMHPNCRSTTIPKLSSDFDFLDKGAVRSSENGYVPAKETYYEWLARQSDATQDEILGPTLGDIFRMPDMTPDKFRKLRLDKTFQPVRVSEIEKKTGFVHGDN